MLALFGEQTEPPLNRPPSLEGLKRFLLRVFVRRYVTWCARRRRFAAMNGAAVLSREVCTS
jgi:hypothetical protein